MRRNNLSQEVGEAILAEIRVGHWPPGERIPSERALMEKFGVGRNALREAVQSLVRIGVLDVQPGRGTTVLSIDGRSVLDSGAIRMLLTDHAIDELYDLRILLEVDGAKKAALVGSADDIHDIHKAAQNYRDQMLGGNETSRADIEFHTRVVRASGNTIYGHVLELLNDRLMSVRELTDLVPGAVELAAAQHEQIALAIEKGDSTAAGRLMKTHIEAGKQAVEALRRRAAP